MKIYISADIEGVSGITHWDEARKESPDYAEFRDRMTAEVKAASEAAVQAGASEILIKDAHGTGRNIDAAALPLEARVIRGWSGHPLSMVQELDDSFHAALFVGYHAAAGCGGNPLAHTMSSSTIAEIRVNGRRASEFLLHAYAAALYGVPVVLVSGDEELCAEVRGLNENIETVAVSRGIGASAVALHPLVARAAIRDSVSRALSRDFRAAALTLPDQFDVSLCYKDHRRAYQNSFYPGARLLDATTVEFRTHDWFEVMRMLGFLS